MTTVRVPRRQRRVAAREFTRTTSVLPALQGTQAFTGHQFADTPIFNALVREWSADGRTVPAVLRSTATSPAPRH